MPDLPDGVQRDYPAAGSGLEVGVVGSGSNLLIADQGVRGQVLKLDEELAGIERFGIELEPEVRALGPVASPADWDQT